MRVRVLFFGMLREMVGTAGESLELPDGAQVSVVVAHYGSRFPRLREMEGSIAAARNQEFCDRSQVLADGDEIALMPPVSGGASPYTQAIENEAGFFALTRQAIDVRSLAAQAIRPSDGALVTFEGVTRNNSNGRATLWLDYECYEAMGAKVMAELGSEIARAHRLGRIVMVHRLGRLEIGETSVVILAAAPHRAEAFAAAREGIDRLKRTVPIWKKEHFTDGDVWVEGQWDGSVVR